jgi:pyruvate formate lyase activating enzyme
MLKVHSIETFGTHEGPGIRLVVFLQGCHFRCVYCHNPDTWDLKGGQSLSVEKVLTYLDSEMPYFKKKGGLTVSGGEPLVQRKELTKLFKAAKLRGVHTALDTNGYIFDNDTKKLLEYTDLVLLDVKHINPLMLKQQYFLKI